VTAWDWMGSLALLPAGYLLAGLVAHHVGAVHVMVWGGILGTLSCALGLVPRSTRTLTRLDVAAPELPGALASRSTAE
jgi:hypothetical protein